MLVEVEALHVRSYVRQQENDTLYAERGISPKREYTRKSHQIQQMSSLSLAHGLLSDLPPCFLANRHENTRGRVRSKRYCGKNSALIP
jgi:hypothetical protein